MGGYWKMFSPAPLNAVDVSQTKGNKHKTHIAIVVNNNERVVGMVTMDDVLEELVGEQKNPKGSDAKC